MFKSIPQGKNENDYIHIDTIFIITEEEKRMLRYELFYYIGDQKIAINKNQLKEKYPFGILGEDRVICFELYCYLTDYDIMIRKKKLKEISI